MSNPPRCPKCGSEMTLRVAKKGRYKGSPFWGCTRYPECNGLINIPGSDSDQVKQDSSSIEGKHKYDIPEKITISIMIIIGIASVIYDIYPLKFTGTFSFHGFDELFGYSFVILFESFLLYVVLMLLLSGVSVFSDRGKSRSESLMSNRYDFHYIPVSIAAIRAGLLLLLQLSGIIEIQRLLVVG